MLKPIQKMLDQAENEKSDSDSAYFDALMYAGEVVMKLTVSGLVAAVQDDKERNRYRLEHQLVRADSLGTWAAVLDDILTGPSSQFLDHAARGTQQDLTQWVSDGTWQFASLKNLRESMKHVQLENDDTTAKIQGRMWFKEFTKLRNGTRGHGAPLASVRGLACPNLRRSIEGVASNLSMLSLPWAYLHQNLSGKYRITVWGETSDTLESLKRETLYSFDNGVYVDLNTLRSVKLVDADPEGSDYWFVNGRFKDNGYDMLSYLTNDRVRMPSTPYMLPAGDLPASETEGLGKLDLTGNVFTNVPDPISKYVPRQQLEKELEDQLTDTDRHFTVTLTGRGGIGKTSTALQVVTKLIRSKNCPYDVVVWFSSRDVDLLDHGPKAVRAQGVSISDFAKEYSKLLTPGEMYVRGFKPQDYLAKQLAGKTTGPTLFVFDNFETTTSPIEIFKWLDTYVRGPNKVLITSRDRRFTGDYVVPVQGMTYSEAKTLIVQTATILTVNSMMTDSYIENLINESNGHPYIIKLMLGEIKSGTVLKKPERIMAGHGEALTALFERSYNRLSPGAKRVFLTLCNWRSSVPTLALEAVLMRPENELIDVQMALEELAQSSFIEEVREESTDESEVNVPLAARLFGLPKLEVSIWRPAIKADTTFLHLLGARTTRSRPELGGRIRQFFNNVATELTKGNKELSEVRPILEFLTTRYPYASVLLAELFAEQGLEDSEEKYYLKYVENPEESVMPGWHIWKRIANIRERRGDLSGEIDALAQICRRGNTPVTEISNTANRINRVLRSMSVDQVPREVKRIQVKDVVGALEECYGELDATDLSRLAWLQVHLGEHAAARHAVNRGLEIDPHNTYCQRLVASL